MAGSTNRRIPKRILAEDRQTLFTLQTLTDYSPRNPALAIDELKRLAVKFAETEEAEFVALRTLEVAREATIAAGQALHEGVLGAKVAVMEQYGVNSPAVHAIGYKQKSERSRPARRARPEA